MPQQQQQRENIKILFVLCLLCGIALHAASGDGDGGRDGVRDNGSYHVHATTCYERAACDVNAETLRSLQAHMHNATPACENFWDYACGDWTAAPYYNHVDTFGAMANQFVDIMMSILWPSGGAGGNTTKTSPESEVPHLLGKMRTYFMACRAVSGYFMRLAAYLEQMPVMRGLRWPEMKSILAALDGRDGESLGALPQFDWLLTVAELRRHGVNGIFFEQTIGWAYNDSMRYVVEIMPPSGSIEYFESRYELVNFMLDFELVGEQQEWQLELADQIYELDMQLRRLREKQQTASNADADEDDDGGDDGDDGDDGDPRISSDEESLTLATLCERVPQIDWRQYFVELLNTTGAPPMQLPIEVVGVSYLRSLSTLLARTPPHVVYMYVLMRLCKFLSAVSPQNTDSSCMLHMGVMMPLGMDYMYDRYAYRRQRAAHERVLTQLLLNLKSQFNKQILANKMQLSAREIVYLQDKLQLMQLRIGNLPLHATQEFYDRYYQTANLSVEHFYHNHWEMLSHRTAAQHAPLLDGGDGRLRNADDYFVNDDLRQVRNAPYFVHQRNLLVVPMMFLQMPFFDHRQLPLLHYSLVGWILAHELQHGYERDGVLYDGRGNENSPLGDDIRQRPRYVRAMQCFERTPTASLIERMADVNGFQLVYDAYFGQLAVETPAMALNGFNARQLFFLHFAQFFCGALPTAIDHDRDDVRVHEIVANMPEFADAFNCRVGEREHPAVKCQMWRE